VLCIVLVYHLCHNATRSRKFSSSRKTLVQHNVPVIAIASNRRHRSSRTRVCKEILFADTGTEEFIQVLEMVGPKLNQKAVLFPCYDESVLLVSRFRQRLEKWYQVILPSPEIVEMLTDKIRFYTFAREKGLPVPRSFFLYCRADAAGGHMSTGRETGNWKNGGGRGPYLLRAHQRGGVTPVAVAGFAQRADLECIGRGRPQTSKRDRRFHACHCLSRPRQGRTTVVNTVRPEVRLLMRLRFRPKRHVE